MRQDESVVFIELGDGIFTGHLLRWNNHIFLDYVGKNYFPSLFKYVGFLRLKVNNNTGEGEILPSEVIIYTFQKKQKKKKSGILK